MFKDSSMQSQAVKQFILTNSLGAKNFFEVEESNNRNDIFILTEMEPGTWRFRKIRVF